MYSQKINRKLSVGTSVLVVSFACLIAGAIEIQALKVKDLRDHPVTKQDDTECLRCHSDKKTIDMMRWKESGANYLFTKEGKLKDSKFAGLTADYRLVCPANAKNKPK